MTLPDTLPREGDRRNRRSSDVGGRGVGALRQSVRRAGRCSASVTRCQASDPEHQPARRLGRVAGPDDGRDGLLLAVDHVVDGRRRPVGRAASVGLAERHPGGGVEEAGADDAGLDQRGADAERGDLRGQRLVEALDAPLGDVVERERREGDVGRPCSTSASTGRRAARAGAGRPPWRAGSTRSRFVAIIAVDLLVARGPRRRRTRRSRRWRPRRRCGREPRTPRRRRHAAVACR